MAWAARAAVIDIHGTWFTEFVMILFTLEIILFRLGQLILSVAIEISSTVPCHCLLFAFYTLLYSAYIKVEVMCK